MTILFAEMHFWLTRQSSTRLAGRTTASTLPLPKRNPVRYRLVEASPVKTFFTPTTTTTQTGFWSAGVGVTIPVLDIPKLMADIRAQDARTEQAVLAYEKSVQTAYGEADNALVRLAADQRRIAQLSAGEQRAARALAAAKTRYEAGLDDLQTMLGVESSWRNARANLTSARVQALRRAVQVYKALGGGWTPPPVTSR